jgi:PhzF family phenazine biosynthesis protein
VTGALYRVNAFTGGGFAGNPAAVALLDTSRDDEWKQQLATEMNVSETAFPERREDGDWDLRWFTPTAEVDLCGHATLATAHVLWSTGRADPASSLLFHTKSGMLLATRLGDGRVELDFPAIPEHMEHVPDDVAAALGLVHHDVHHAGRTATKYRLIVVHTASIVRDLAPDFAALRAAGDDTYIVTSEADDAEHDIVSRYFAPAYGIDEDPATGAAHCVITPYWTTRLARTVLRCHQASARGAELECEIRGDRVKLRGLAVTITEDALPE